MSEMTYERLEMKSGWNPRRGTDGNVWISSTFTPDEQKRLGEWLLMDPPPEPVKVGESVEWNEWEWEVIGLYDDRVWLVCDDGRGCRYRNPLTSEVEVIR